MIDEALLDRLCTTVLHDARMQNSAADCNRVVLSHYEQIRIEHGEIYAKRVYDLWVYGRHLEMASKSGGGNGGTTINTIVQNGPGNAAQTAPGTQTVSGSISPAPEAHGIGHLKAVAPLYMVIVVLTFFISIACITGGIYSIYRNAQGVTEFSLWGAKLSTGHVGVAFVGIGLIVGLFTIRSVLKSVRDIGTAPKP